MKLEYYIMMIIVIFSSMINFNRSLYGVLGIAIVASYIILAAISIKRKSITSKSFIIIILSIIVGTLIIIGNLYFVYSDAIDSILFSVIAIIPFFLMEIKLNDKQKNRIIDFVIVISTINLFITNFLNPALSAGVSNWGRISVAFYIVFVYFRIYKINRRSINVKNIIYLIIFVLNIYALIWTGSRSVLYMFLAFAALALITRKIDMSKCKKIIKIVFITIMIVQIFIPYIYIFIYNNRDIRDTLYDISMELTGKPFFTGREVLWDSIIEDSYDEMILGVGDQDFELQENSSHNIILYVTYVYGYVIGLITIAFQIKIFLSMYKNIKSKNQVYWVLAYICIIGYNCFENLYFSLTYNYFYNLIMIMVYNFVKNENILEDNKEEKSKC